MQALFSEVRAKLDLMPSTFGDLVARRRREMRLSQRDLARRIGKSATYITYIESGKNPSARSGVFTPTVDAVDKIAKVLDIPQSEARNAAGYAAPITEPQTIRELKQRLWDLGVHLEFSDDLDDNNPEDLERAKHSIAALMNAIFPPKK